MKPKFYYMLEGALFFLSGQLLILGVSKIVTAVNADTVHQIVIPEPKRSEFQASNQNTIIKQLHCTNEILLAILEKMK